MFDKRLLSNTLSDLGYRRINATGRKPFSLHIYKASWSTLAVEQFLYFNVWGMPKRNLSCYFGLRNRLAEAFGLRTIVAYGRKMYGLMQHDPLVDCHMCWELGRIASWGRRSSLDVSVFTGQAFREKIRTSIEMNLWPTVRNITDEAKLLAYLLSDTESHSWIFTNAAIRAAQVVSLARQINISTEVIRNMLKPHEKAILTALFRAPEPLAYVDNILHDSMTAQ